MLLLLTCSVAHGALPHIGGARLDPGQLSFATLLTSSQAWWQRRRRRRSTGRWFSAKGALASCTRLLLRPEECSGFASRS